MKTSIRRKILLAITIPLLVFATAFTYLKTVRIREDLKARARVQLQASTRQKSLEMKLTLMSVEAVARSTANFLEVNPGLSPAQIFQRLYRSVGQSASIYGAAIAFEPNTFSGRRRFSPYVYRGQEGLLKPTTKLKQMDIARVYDYLKWEWYQGPKRAGKSVWSRPYFDKGAGNVVMTTYSVPFYYKGKLRGITTVDVAMPVLGKILNNQTTPGAQFFIVTRNGTYVYSPDAKLILNGSLLKEAKAGRSSLRKLAKAMTTGQEGFYDVRWNGRREWVAIAPLNSVGWSLGLRVPLRVVVAPAYAEMREQILNTTFVLIVVLTIIYVAVGTLLQPLAGLNRAAVQVARGDLAVALDTERGDELGQLAIAFTDMAARLQAREAALRASRGDRLAQMLEGINGNFYSYSLRPNGEVEHVSSSVESILGYAPDEYKRVANQIKSNSAVNNAAQAKHLAALQGNFPPIFEVEYVHKDGSRRSLEVCERPVVDGNGQVVSVEGLVSDVTERQRATDWFRNLLESAPDALVITDKFGRILLVNGQTELIFGYSRDEMIGQQAELLRSSRLRQATADWTWNNLEQKRRQTDDPMFELFGQRKNGEEFPIEISQQPFLFEDRWGEVVSTVVRDVTQRRQAERELRQVQQRVALAAEAGKISFGEQDLTNDEGWLSGHVANLIGGGDEIYRGDIGNYILPEDSERVRAERDAFLRSDATEYGIGYRIRDLAGEIHWIEVKGKIQRDPDGTAQRLVAVLVDVTERELAAQEQERTNRQLAERTAELAHVLGHTSSRLQGIMDNSPAAIWAKDEHGVYLFANDAYRTMFDIGDREIVGHTDDDFFPPDAAAGFRANDLLVIGNRETGSYVEHVGLPNGVETVLSVKFPLYDEDGEVYAAAGMCLDITEQLRLQEELRKLNEELEQRVEERTSELSQAYEALQVSEARLTKTTESAPCLIYQFTIRPDGSAYFPYASSFLKVFSGVAPSDVLEDATPLTRYFHPDDWAGFNAAVAESVRSRDLFHHEWRFLFDDGRLAWVQAVSRPEFFDNGEILWNGVLMDITERKQIEEELHAAKLVADAANKAKGDFLANMSHEIRTPMNAILGMTHLTLQTELTGRQHSYLQRIETSAHNLMGIINDILDFSKIEAGKLQVEAINFDLEEVLRNISDTLSVTAQEKQLELHFRWEAGVPSHLVGDPLRLGQILLNLVGNALKFTEEGEVEVAVSKVLENDASVELRFSVRDTGIGLSQEQLARLFRAFSQADTSTTRKYGGTGLGLTICKRLVELMGGAMSIASEPNVGTTVSFTITLPKQSAKPDLEPNRMALLEGRTALVVDDNATSREILSLMMESFHFEVAQASSGGEALDAWRDAPQPFDVVLMDWQMPAMDGIATARHMTAESVEPPPIVMITAYGREEVVQQAAEAGIANVLVKPVSPSLLLDAIMQVLGKDNPILNVPTNIDRVSTYAQSLAGHRVLLVEDNEINQEVACEILNNAGLEVTVAPDGEKGVEAVRAAAATNQQFDAVLMDCQMPVLDGYAATRLLREDQRFAELPIIAMTASALAGDREKSFAAGMNDHVTKPIDLEELFGTLSKWIKSAADTSPPKEPLQFAEDQLQTLEVPVLPEAPVLPGVDRELGLSHMGGNEALYRRLLIMFADGKATAVAEIRSAHNANDVELATRLAHTLKGVAGNIGAQNIFEMANAVELALSGGTNDGLEELLDKLQQQLDPLVRAITALSAEEKPAAAARGASGFDSAVVQPLLAKLLAALQRSQSSAAGIIGELAPLLSGTQYTATLNAMARAMERYDFEDALGHWPELAELLQGEN